MRLINVHTLKLECFPGKEKPPYVILSHTWGSTEEEVSFIDFQDLAVSHKKVGFRKIALMCSEAKATGIDYAWADTCCIDKSSSSEQSEAINSMFRWYSDAKICYAYLSDIRIAPDDDPDEILATSGHDLLKKSRWFTRGWTLQELIAPNSIVFFDSNWRKIGDKISCCHKISSITGIDKAVLLDPSKIFKKLYATRLFWAAKRQTTRPEDTAYCLMGLFGVHMPLLYGEGDSRAFKRLQLELVKLTSSHSLLTWGLDFERHIGPGPDLSRIFPETLTQRPILAHSPSLFSWHPAIRRLHTGNDEKPWVVTNRGIEIEVLVITRENWFVDTQADQTGVQKRFDLAIAILPLKPAEGVSGYLGMLLSGNSLERRYNRISSHEGYATVKVPAKLAVLAKKQKICLSEVPVYREWRTLDARSKLVLVKSIGFQIQDVFVHRCDWSKGDQSLMLHPEIPEEFQESLLRIVDEKDRESRFYLLVSNSVIVPDTILPPYSRTDYWRFRKIGIAVVRNDYAEKLFRSASGLPQQGLMTKEQNLTVNLGSVKAKITLEEKVVYWDIIYILNIIATS